MKLRDLDSHLWLTKTIESGRAARLRVGAGLSQEALGSLCGSTGPAVSLWENGKRVPRGQRALKYAEVLRRLDRAGCAS